MSDLAGSSKYRGAAIRDAGGSDWIVYPRQKEYTLEERYSHHYLIGEINSALRDNQHVSADTLGTWIQKRHAHIDHGEQAVFGTIRYMNAVGLKRTFDADAYVKKVERLVKGRAST